MVKLHSRFLEDSAKALTESSHIRRYSAAKIVLFGALDTRARGCHGPLDGPVRITASMQGLGKVGPFFGYSLVRIQDRFGSMPKSLDHSHFLLNRVIRGKVQVLVRMGRFSVDIR